MKTFRKLIKNIMSVTVLNNEIYHLVCYFNKKKLCHGFHFPNKLTIVNTYS